MEAPDVDHAPSPTHVGMDLRGSADQAHGHTKPHARGDGPRSRAAYSASHSQAPRTWGWTVHRFPDGSITVPSPTHVGMDRGP